MTASRAPSTVARTGIALATWPLDPPDRWRYRAEFLAELHDLPPADQLRFTAGVLSQTFALRAALGAAPTRAEEATMTLTRTRFYWRCRVLHWHRWVQRSTEDGRRYDTCARCGRDQSDFPGGTPNIGAGAGWG